VLGAALLVVGCSGDEAQPEPGVDAFCARIAPLADLDGELGSGDPDLVQLAGDVGEALVVAPRAVQPSLEMIADALTTMVDAAAASGEEGQAALAAAFAAIEGDRAALERASALVEDYAGRECGVDLTPGDAGAPEGTTAGPNPAPSPDG